ncbi:MAG: hypothetical protein KME06_01480 [Kastovskya adunca ATA6-11-RM4]|nr:hypothetical protein [Kastovskya adunca ATA6-11-RM4]
MPNPPLSQFLKIRMVSQHLGLGGRGDGSSLVVFVKQHSYICLFTALAKLTGTSCQRSPSTGAEPVAKRQRHQVQSSHRMLGRRGHE